jgi:hypothetical protein
MARDGIVSTRGKHKRQRSFPGARCARPDNKKLHQDEARERQEAWAKLSPQEQLRALDGRPGESRNQRARIQARVDRPRVATSVNVAREGAVGDKDVRVKAKDRRTQERKERPGSVDQS